MEWNLVAHTRTENKTFKNTAKRITNQYKTLTEQNWTTFYHLTTLYEKVEPKQY